MLTKVLAEGKHLRSKGLSRHSLGDGGWCGEGELKAPLYPIGQWFVLFALLYIEGLTSWRLISKDFRYFGCRLGHHCPSIADAGSNSSGG